MCYVAMILGFFKFAASHHVDTWVRRLWLESRQICILHPVLGQKGVKLA